MLSNYLKIAFRNLWNNKLFVIINLISMAFAMDICFLAYLNYRYNTNFNKVHKNYENIYKIEGNLLDSAQYKNGSLTAYSLADSIQKKFPEVPVSHLFYTYHFVRTDSMDNKCISVYSDKNLFHIFSFPFLYGNYSADSNMVFLSYNFAKNNYGETNPVGKTIKIYNGNDIYELKIGGVIDDMPKNQSLIFDIVLNYRKVFDIYKYKHPDWANNDDALFVHTESKTKIKLIENYCNLLLTTHNTLNGSLQYIGFEAVPFENICKEEFYALESKLSGVTTGQVARTMFSSFLVLLLAGFNFINTSIALAAKRLKEIGIRKVVGAHRRAIITQFMLENLILILFSALIALFMCELFVSAYNKLYSYVWLEFSLIDVNFWFFLFALIFAINFAAGGYPAFFISKYLPVNLFKGKVKLGSNNLLVKGLIATQFAITTYLLFAFVYFSLNETFQKKMDRGYDYDNLIYMWLYENDYEKYETIIHNTENIVAYSGSGTHIGVYFIDNKVNVSDSIYDTGIMNVGENYLATINVSFLEGRNFNSLSDTANKVIVNKAFLDSVNWQSAVGKTITQNNQQYEIIGVVNNFHEKNLVSKNIIRPVIIKLIPKKDYLFLVIRAKDGMVKEVNNALKMRWEENNTTGIYRGMIQGENLLFEYYVNVILKKINLLLAIIAILISSLGLYTQVSLLILKKAKEIGIRKTFGAFPFDLMKFLGKEFLILLLIGYVPSIIGSYFLLNHFLDTIFEFHIKFHLFSVVFPLLIIFGVYIFAIGLQIAKAAQTSPSEYLRDE